MKKVSLMKIEVEIPEWAKDRVIYVMAGSENVAVLCDGKLWIKTARCSICGECCIVEKDWELGWKYGDEIGWEPHILVCKFLKKEVWNFEPFNGQTVYICTNPLSPYGCNTGPSPACGQEDFKKGLPKCTLEYIRREVQ